MLRRIAEAIARMMAFILNIPYAVAMSIFGRPEDPEQHRDEVEAIHESVMADDRIDDLAAEIERERQLKAMLLTLRQPGVLSPVEVEYDDELEPAHAM